MAVRLVACKQVVVPYVFTAQTLAQAEQRMAQLGPKDADGRHAASCAVKAMVRDDASLVLRVDNTLQQRALGWVVSVAVDAATLEYTPVLEMPVWLNLPTLPPPVVAEWLRFLRCLQLHEDGHLAVARPILEKQRRWLEGLQVAAAAPSQAAATSQARADLRRQVGAIHQQVTAECEAAFATYDRRVDHGRKQGARLNTSITGARSKGRR